MFEGEMDLGYTAFLFPNSFIARACTVVQVGLSMTWKCVDTRVERVERPKTILYGKCILRYCMTIIAILNCWINLADICIGFTCTFCSIKSTIQCT